MEIGDKVVALRSHSRGVYKKGVIYTILGIKLNHCLCCTVAIDIGIRDNLPAEIERCSDCNIEQRWTPIWWMNYIHFRKVDESFAHEVLENIKEQIEEEQLVLK